MTVQGLHHITRVSADAQRTDDFYTRVNDPDGHIVELATVGPGFTVEKTPAELGQALKLPPWLEDQRGQVERLLRPLHVRARPVLEVV